MGLDGQKERVRLGKVMVPGGGLLWPGRLGTVQHRCMDGGDQGPWTGLGRGSLAGVLGRETEKVELEKARGEALPQGFLFGCISWSLASTAPRVLAPIQRPWHA